MHHKKQSRRLSREKQVNQQFLGLLSILGGVIEGLAVSAVAYSGDVVAFVIFGAIMIVPGVFLMVTEQDVL